MNSLANGATHSKEQAMIHTYTTQGRLMNLVNDIGAARTYLLEHGQDMAQHIYPEQAKPGVHSVTWDLLNDQSWKVTVIVEGELSAEQSALLSEWISGQNSDGLGEGFEQQPFAEEDDEDDEYSVVMSSFDWQTNDCELTLVK